MNELAGVAKGTVACFLVVFADFYYESHASMLTWLVIEPIGNGDVACIPDRSLRSRVLVRGQLSLRLHNVLMIPRRSSVHVCILLSQSPAHSHELFASRLRFLLKTDLFLQLCNFVTM